VLLWLALLFGAHDGRRWKLQVGIRFCSGSRRKAYALVLRVSACDENGAPRPRQPVSLVHK
jgi:hypothetical protein